MKTDSTCTVGLMILVAPWVLAMAGCGSPPVPSPTAFGNFNSKDGTFQCEYPEDWEAKGGGRKGPTWAKFTHGSAEIKVTADVAGSVLGDIAGGGSRIEDVELPPELQPVAKVHEFGKNQAEESDRSYTEVGEPQVVDNRLGPSRYSEFTTSGTFGGSIRGYRATILARDKRVVVYCTCSDSDWTTLQPAFVQVLTSFKRGREEL